MTHPSVSVGAKAPDFTLPRDGGGQVTLSKCGRAVVYFYPKDDTPGCTIEAQDFSALADDFAKEGVQLIGISKDSPASHDKFCAKYGLKIILASDADNQVCETYGVWVDKAMYGKKYKGIARTTFLINADGTIAQIWPKVRPEGHAQAVLEAVRQEKPPA